MAKLLRKRAKAEEVYQLLGDPTRMKPPAPRKRTKSSIKSCD